MPASSTELTVVLPYNDTVAVEKAFAEYGDRIACLITEAAPGNMGVVPPNPGFNRFLAATCSAHGALFISDEVMTGFRASKLGQWGLDGAVEGWRPDLMTFGKVMGGGFPAAAFGGRGDVMSQLSPEGPVYQAGTLSGNPVATTAGLATLRLATDEVYAHIASAAETIKAAAADALTAAGVPHVIQASGTMFSVFFTDSAVADFDGARRTDLAAYKAFFHAMLDRASTCRRRRSRRGSCPPPTTTGPSSPFSTRCPRAAEQAARAASPPKTQPTNPTCKGPDERPDHRPPPAPWRGAQPDGVLYGRMPGYVLSDLGVQMAAACRRGDQGPRHHPPAGVTAGAGAADRPAARRRPAVSRSSPTTG